jgi:hypothetical protein
MSAAEMLAGAAPRRVPDWHSIDWRKVWQTVRRLQARIVKAVAEGRWNKVKALVYLLTHSYSGRALAILRVVSPEPSVIFSQHGAISKKKLENPAGFWNNGGENTSSLFQNKGAFE